MSLADFLGSAPEAPLPSVLDLHPDLLAAGRRIPATAEAVQTPLTPFDDERAELRAHQRRLLLAAGAAVGCALASAGAIAIAVG